MGLWRAIIASSRRIPSSRVMPCLVWTALSISEAVLWLSRPYRYSYEMRVRRNALDRRAIVALRALVGTEVAGAL